MKNINIYLLKGFIIIFCSFFAFQVPSFATSSTSKKTKVMVKPSTLVPGGVGLVKIFTPDKKVRLKKITFRGNDIPFFFKDDCYIALIGAGLKVKKGEKKLIIKLDENGQERIIIRNIPIKDKIYPKEYLKVPKKMASFSKPILKRVLADQKAIKKACSNITEEIYWHGKFIWPVPKRITSPFGLRRYFNGEPRSPHSGVDLKAPLGTNLKAPNNGKVALLRNCYLSGLTLVIDHGGGLFTLYAHLDKSFVKMGDKVKKGQILGLTGSSGRITGPHLHYGISLLGERVDPKAFMALMGK